jgi:type I restriction enzyme S subunit
MSVFPHKQFRFLFSVSSGATPESGNSAFWDGDIFWATPEDVSGVSKTLSSTRRRITKEGFDNCSAKMAPAGSIVLTKRAPIGQLAISEVELCCNQGCFLLEPTTEANSEFFYYWLSQQTAYLQVLGRGSTFMELSTDEIKAIRAPCIPIAKQKQISEFLNDETADIDALITAKQRLLELLAEKRRAIVAEAVMRGLNPAAPLRPSGIGWLGEIPAHWQMKRSKWLFEERDERSTDGSEVLLSLRMERGLVPHNDVSEKLTRPEELIGYKKTSIGQVVVNRMRAATGLIAITTQDGLVSPDYAVFRPSPGISADYYVEMFKTPLLQAVFRSESTGLGTGSQGFLRLYSQNFLALWFPYPPLEEQQKIVRHIGTETAKIDRLKAATEHSITLLKERRGALIAAAVTGQIDILEAA